MKDYVISIHVPAWGTTFGAMSKSFGFSISIHVPAWGTTCIAESEGRKINISIHVPAWGTTIPGIHSLPRQRFQSTFPRGERLFTVEQYGYAAKFQSTFPRGERQPDDRGIGNLYGFQSTFPRGERRKTCGLALDNSEISIHVPAWGTTHFSTFTY